MDLRERVELNIAEHALLDDGDAVLIGVSGGLDSMALLHLLREIAARKNWKVSIAHFNHCLRGAESDGDETFVRKVAATFKLPFHSASGDVRAAAKAQGTSIEMAARELRHRFLIETAKKLGIGRIALAHHADDQIETFWLRLLRGDLGPGQAGIRWKRPAGFDSKIFFIRPLLNISKKDLLSFARDKQIGFRDDASNRDPSFLRNRLRLEILPQLEKFQPALRELTLRHCEVLGAEKAFLKFEAQHWLEARQRPFSDLHIALQREVVRLQLITLGMKPTFEIIEHLRLKPERSMSVTALERVIRTLDGDVQMAVSPNLEFSAHECSIDLSSEGGLTFENVELKWTLVTDRHSSSPGLECFDADAIGPTITLRHWKSGDRFQPVGSQNASKLQDLFTNHKVAAEEKRHRLLAVAFDGKIFWVEGLRISEAFKVTSQTRRFLRWEWRRES